MLQNWDPVIGLVAGSYHGCSEALHSLAREAAEARARSEWRRMGARSEHEALGLHARRAPRRWGRQGRACRLRVIGLPNAEFLPPWPAARIRARPRGCWRG